MTIEFLAARIEELTQLREQRVNEANARLAEMDKEREEYKAAAVRDINMLNGRIAELEELIRQAGEAKEEKVNGYGRQPERA